MSEAPRTFNDDFEALNLLRSHNVREVRNGILKSSTRFKDLSPEAQEAVQYLLDEWDFDFYYHPPTPGV